MPVYKILGIYSYAENLKNIKLNDSVILKNEKYNIKSKNAIGVYTTNNKKIGYISEDYNKKNINYKITKIVLNQDNPLVEISSEYLLINYLENVEYPYEKKLKYNYNIINIPEELNTALIKLEKYLQTKKIKLKRSAVIYYDENYINLLIETKKIEKLETVTLKYFKENKDKYEELYENKLIDVIFYRELLIYRLECYYEQVYTNILDYKDYELDYSFTEKKIHNNLKYSLLFFKIYIKYLITNDNYYLLKINEIPLNDLNVIQTFIDDNKLKIGNFMYDHQLKIYDYIEFINDNSVFVISDEINSKYLYSAYLAQKQNLIIYNPQKGIINYIELKNLN
jgi:hypothetical protein